MFLRLASVGPLRNDERGSALVAVLGVFALTIVVSVVIAATTLSALGFTSSTKATVQSVTAAESGLDFATAAATTAACPSGGRYTSLTSPKYAVQIAWSTSTDPTTTAWTNGCPAGGAQLVKFTSVGTATAKGAAGNTSGDVSKVEAIYTTTFASPGITATGAALYAYSSSGFTGSGGLTSGTGSVPSVQVRHGDVTCNGGSPTYADVVVADGKFTGTGSCTVSGYVWASKDVSIEGGVVVGSSVVGDKIQLKSSARVGGSVWGSEVRTEWGAYTEGGVTTSKLVLAGGNIKGEAWSSGEAAFSGGGIVIDGHLTAKFVTGSGTTRGGRTIISTGPGAGPARPATPLVPNWIEFKYNLADWNGFTERVLPVGACDYTMLQNAADLLASTPGIIDARNCTNRISISSYQKLNLSNDLAIIAKSFNLGGSTGFTSSAPRKLWLITPDDVNNGLPTCTTSGFEVGGGVTVGAQITALIYTPCDVKITSGIRWPGQVFGATTAIDGDARLVYYPMGLPGIDLATGTVTPSAPVTPGLVLISQVAYRDVHS